MTLAKGYASVIVEYNSGCRAKMTISWDETSVKQLAEEIGNKSINIDENNDMMIVSPNPTKGDISVSFATSGERKIAIVGLNGEIVFSAKVSAKVNSISLSDVTPGLYSVVATDGVNKYYSKLAVK